MDELRKNEIYEARCEALTSEALGVFRIGGRAVFARGALPGELWRVRIVKTGRTVVYGRGEELLEPSAERRESPCPAFGRCGGCACLHMSYEAELRFKLRKVNDALRRIGGLELEAEDIIGSDARYGYRNKAVFALGGSAEAPVSGFFRPRTHEVVGVEGCLLQNPTANALAAAVRDWMRAHGVAPYDVNSGKGAVRHVFARTARDGSAVCCVVSARGFGRETPSLVEALRAACPELAGVVLCLNKSRGNTVLTGEFRTLWGRAELVDTLCGSEFEIAPQAFYQVNPPQAERLYAIALDFALPEPGGEVFELYCGAGTISLSLARRAKRVVAAEIVPEAVENARANARRNGVENVEFICADAAEAAARYERMGERPDAVVVDPPRKGMSEEALDRCAAMRPERIVYVSCDCATLARDAKRLAAKGYKAQRARCVDMFPATGHVETVVLLSKGEVDSKKIRVEFSLEDMDMSEFQDGATYPQIKAYVLEHSGLKVSNLYISQIKRKCGIEVGKNYNLPKSEDSRQPQCPPEKEKAIREAFKYFGMI